MALWNYSKYNEGIWVPLNIFNVDDGFGNLISNYRNAVQSSVFTLSERGYFYD